jgi:capsular polysaccharide biosynthesis protein
MARKRAPHAAERHAQRALLTPTPGRKRSDVPPASQEAPPHRARLAASVRNLHREWWLAAVSLFVAVAAALVYVTVTPPTYRATAKIVILQGGSLVAPEGPSSLSLTQTLSEILRSQTVVDQSLQSSGIDLSPEKVLEQLQVTNVPDASVLVVNYEDRDPRRASALLAAVTRAFATTVEQRLDTPTSEPGVRISARTLDEAHTLPYPVAPRRRLIVVVAAVLGLGLGLLLAGWTRPRRLAAVDAAVTDRPRTERTRSAS